MKLEIHDKFKKILEKPIEHYDEAVNTHQIEDLANRKFSLNAYSYYTTGSLDNQSLLENIRAFQRYKILPRCLVDISGLDTSVELLGEKIDIPICIAPTAMHKLAHHNGEIATAQAATELNTLLCLSSICSYSLTEVAKHAKVKWMQFYVPKDLKVAEKQIKMIENAGYTALVVTIDTPTFGIRDFENLSRFDGPEGAIKKKSSAVVESGMGQFFTRTFNLVRFFNYYIIFFI